MNNVWDKDVRTSSIIFMNIIMKAIYIHPGYLHRNMLLYIYNLHYHILYCLFLIYHNFINTSDNSDKSRNHLYCTCACAYNIYTIATFNKMATLLFCSCIHILQPLIPLVKADRTSVYPLNLVVYFRTCYECSQVRCKDIRLRGDKA